MLHEIKDFVQPNKKYYQSQERLQYGKTKCIGILHWINMQRIYKYLQKLSTENPNNSNMNHEWFNELNRNISRKCINTIFFVNSHHNTYSYFDNGQ